MEQESNKDSGEKLIKEAALETEADAEVEMEQESEMDSGEKPSKEEEQSTSGGMEDEEEGQKEDSEKEKEPSGVSFSGPVDPLGRPLTEPSTSSRSDRPASPIQKSCWDILGGRGKKQKKRDYCSDCQRMKVEGEEHVCPVC